MGLHFDDAGKLDCEDLPIEDCAFSVASSGTRCVLEKYRSKEGSVQYVCQVAQCSIHSFIHENVTGKDMKLIRYRCAVIDYNGGETGGVDRIR